MYAHIGLAMVLITACPTMQQHSLVCHCQVPHFQATRFSGSLAKRSAALGFYWCLYCKLHFLLDYVREKTYDSCATEQKNGGLVFGFRTQLVGLRMSVQISQLHCVKKKVIP